MNPTQHIATQAGNWRTRLTITVVIASVGMVAAGAAPSVARANKPSYGCSPGMNLGAYTISDYMQLPRTAAAVDQGLVSADAIIAALSTKVDKNGDQVVCVQLSQGKQVNNQPFGEYLYNVVDDEASTP
jgi:hypothetical protein